MKTLGSFKVYYVTRSSDKKLSFFFIFIYHKPWP